MIKACKVCNIIAPVKYKSYIHPIASHRPLERFVMDFKEMNVDPATGDRWLLMVSDHFSKFAWAASFPTKDSEHVAMFLKNLFLQEGTPDILQADNGKEFSNEVIYFSFSPLPFSVITCFSPVPKKKKN